MLCLILFSLVVSQTKKKKEKEFEKKNVLVCTVLSYHGRNFCSIPWNQEWSEVKAFMLQARLDWWLPCRYQVCNIHCSSRSCLGYNMFLFNVPNRYLSEAYEHHYCKDYNLFEVMLCKVIINIFIFWSFRILAPTTYIFFASAIPVISFGEQLERNTGRN